MGAKAAKPNPPSDNKAKAIADLAMDGLTLAASDFLSQVRLGTAGLNNLGYKLTDQKLTNQEIQIMVKTQDNVEPDDINAAIDSCFSGDWKGVTKFAAKEIIQFLGGQPPSPAEEAVNATFSKSYIVWEFNSLVQYSLYMKKTNASSVGTLTADTQITVLACICRGVVDYDGIDPQLILYEVCQTQPDLLNDADKFQKLMEAVSNELKASATMSAIKRQLNAGVIPGTTGESGKAANGIDIDDLSRRRWNVNVEFTAAPPSSANYFRMACAIATMASIIFLIYNFFIINV
ncbi:hypothetical protein R1sor_025673 [Riccia sorocarpa]|uniref:Uncharacterized protein n=1 Tax=Riccia sorocarpa TaxID=122646 RepID=A0ABD3GCB6_9MARC